MLIVIFRMRRRARVAPPVNAADDEVSYQDEFPPPEPPVRRRGRGRPRAAGRPRQRDAQAGEPAEQADVDAEFAAEVPQNVVPNPPAVPQRQPAYQQAMSDPEAALFYARVGRITFDGTSDPLDFLHAIETRTRTAHSEYQRIMIVELSVEGPALDWFMQVIQP